MIVFLILLLEFGGITLPFNFYTRKKIAFTLYQNSWPVVLSGTYTVFSFFYYIKKS